MPLKHSVEEIVLKNGMRGLFIYTPDATFVHYDIDFRAGNRYVKSPEISQVAHILEHMSFGPNQQFDSLEEFSQEFSRNGAYSNAFTSTIGLNYEASTSYMEWRRILELQLLAITKPTFRQDTLEAEKGNVREEISGYGSNHSRILWQTVMRKSGLDRWYDADELKTIDPVTIDNIKEHYTATHTLSNMRFVFAGDLEAHKEELIAMLEAVDLPKGERLALPAEHAIAGGPVHIYRQDLPSISFVLEFFINRQLARSELRAMNVVCYLLTDTFHSRVFGKARAQGICYGIGSGVGTEPMGYSEWGFSGQVSEENAQKLFELIAEQLLDIAENGVSDDELEQAKKYRLGVMQMGTETVRSLASWYEPEYYDNEKIDHVSVMVHLINGTTNEEMQQLVKEFLGSGIWTLGEIGNIPESVTDAHHTLLQETLLNKVK